MISQEKKNPKQNKSPVSQSSPLQAKYPYSSSGVPDLRASRSRPKMPLLSLHRSYPHLRAICSYVGRRANSELFLVEERQNSWGEKSRAKPGYSFRVQVESPSKLIRFQRPTSALVVAYTACMDHDCITLSWRELDNGSTENQNAPPAYTPAHLDSVPIRKTFFFSVVSAPLSRTIVYRK